MYENTQTFLIEWDELDMEDLNYVKKCLDDISISIYECNVKVYSSVYDKEKDEMLLGGHFIETFLSLDDLKKEEFEWDLS